MQYDDNYFMEQALQQAKDAYDEDESMCSYQVAI
jgi:tRNA(Arg) A34 adenosine deaminase TadA